MIRLACARSSVPAAVLTCRPPAPNQPARQRKDAHDARIGPDPRPPRSSLHHRRHLAVRVGDLAASRRPSHRPPRRIGRVRAARRRVPRGLVGHRLEHRHPEVLPWSRRHARARILAAPGGRPRGRCHHGMGRARRLLRGPGRGRDVLRRAAAPARASVRVVQLAGVVQHRGAGCRATGLGVLHPRRRGRPALHPQLVRGGGHHLQGWLRRGCQPVEDPIVEGAAERWRHAVRTGQLHAGSRRLRRHDQERRHDPSGRQDGHPRRGPPRHLGVHLVQGPRGAQGACPARRRLRHGPRRRRLRVDAVPERQQLRPAVRRVHAGRRRRRRVGAHGAHRRTRGADRAGPRAPARDRRGVVGVRRPRRPVRHHHQPLEHHAQCWSHHCEQPMQ